MRKRLKRFLRKIKRRGRDAAIDPDRYHFTAHRGLSGMYPENTVQAFRAAAQERFKAIETDIWEVRDFYESDDAGPGFVIMHNGDTSGMCDVKVPVGQLTSAIISDYLITKGKGNRSDTDYTIPTLEDFLDIMKESDKELIIEIKDPDISHEGAIKLIRLLTEEGFAKRTVFGSFYKKSLLTLQAVTDESDGFRFQKFIGTRDRARISQEIDWSINSGMDIVSIKGSLLTKKLLSTVKAAGLQTEVWVINDRYEAADFLKRGVDRITTNELLW